VSETLDETVVFALIVISGMDLADILSRYLRIALSLVSIGTRVKAQKQGASALARVGMPNGGLQVVNPSKNLYSLILDRMSSGAIGSYEFANLLLLGDLFSEKWVALLYTCNSLKTLPCVHLPIWRDNKVKNIHYILSAKPWDERPGEESQVTHKWWVKANRDRIADEKSAGTDDGFKIELDFMFTLPIEASKPVNESPPPWVSACEVLNIDANGGRMMARVNIQILEHVHDREMHSHRKDRRGFYIPSCKLAHSVHILQVAAIRWITCLLLPRSSLVQFPHHPDGYEVGFQYCDPHDPPAIMTLLVYRVALTDRERNYPRGFLIQTIAIVNPLVQPNSDLSKN